MEHTQMQTPTHVNLVMTHVTHAHAQMKLVVTLVYPHTSLKTTYVLKNVKQEPMETL
jgi:hypothetical protein